MSKLKQNPDVSPEDLFGTSAGAFGSTTQGIDLGAQFTTGDGRVFRYALVGATALVPGQVYQGPAESTSTYELLGVSTAVATGATLVTIGSSVTIVANALAGGLMTVATSTGSGYTYKIAANTGVTSATGCVITLEDPLVTNLATTTQVNCYPNPYNGIIVCPTTLSSNPVGIAVAAVAASSYGWIQTHGLVGALSDSSAPSPGLAITASTATAGNIAKATGTQVVIGYSTQTQTSAKYGFVYLTID